MTYLPNCLFMFQAGCRSRLRPGHAPRSRHGRSGPEDISGYLRRYGAKSRLPFFCQSMIARLRRCNVDAGGYPKWGLIVFERPVGSGADLLVCLLVARRRCREALRLIENMGFTWVASVSRTCVAERRQTRRSAPLECREFARGLRRIERIYTTGGPFFFVLRN